MINYFELMNPENGILKISTVKLYLWKLLFCEESDF